MAPTRVTVEAELEAIMPRYLELGREDVARILEAVAGDDAQTARLAGHRFKGTGTSYGLPRVSALGAAIEATALEGDLARAGDLARELLAYLDDLDIVYAKED